MALHCISSSSSLGAGSKVIKVVGSKVVGNKVVVVVVNLGVVVMIELILPLLLIIPIILRFHQRYLLLLHSHPCLKWRLARSNTL